MNDIVTAINQNRAWLHAEEMTPEERKQRTEELRSLRHRLAHAIIERKTNDPGSKVEFAQ